MEESDRKLIAGLLNELFHLPIDWTSFEAGQDVQKSDLVVISELLKQLSPKLRDPQLLQILWTLTQTNKSLDRPVTDVFSGEQAKEIQRKIRNDLFNSGRKSQSNFSSMFGQLNALSSLGTERRPPVSGWNAGVVDNQFDDFLLIEKRILSAAGLDQAAVRTIIERLSKKRRPIVRNIAEHRVIYIERYTKAIDVTLNIATSMLNMKNKSGRVKTKRMKSLKDRIVGVATIWGDLTPLIFGEDLGVASFWSTIAGATAMVALPGSD